MITIKEGDWWDLKFQVSEVISDLYLRLSDGRIIKNWQEYEEIITTNKQGTLFYARREKNTIQE